MFGVGAVWLVVVAVVLRAGGLGPDERGKLLVVFPPGTAPADAGLAVAGCFAWAADRPVPHDPFARALEARAAAGS